MSGIRLGSVYTTEYWIVYDTEFYAALWLYSVVTIICVDSIYTLSECKKGIRWSINGTGIMGMGLGAFLFFEHFCFFSLARFGFSKKSDEKQRSNKVHPNSTSRLSHQEDWVHFSASSSVGSEWVPSSLNFYLLFARNNNNKLSWNTPYSYLLYVYVEFFHPARLVFFRFPYLSQLTAVHWVLSLCLWESIQFIMLNLLFSPFLLTAQLAISFRGCIWFSINFIFPKKKERTSRYRFVEESKEKKMKLIALVLNARYARRSL